MASKIKNIIIFTAVAAALILVYIFFIKKEPESDNLVPVSSNVAVSPNEDTLNQNSLIARDLLSILLNIKNIKLDSSIFTNQAFVNLHDSSIVLVPTGDEGRPNPFAPIGYEALVIPPSPTIEIPEEIPFP